MELNGGRFTTEATLTQVRFQPLGDRVIVKAVEQAETVRGGIVIPETAKEKPQEGIILACGKGKTTEAGRILHMDVSAGERVLYAKYSGTKIKIDEQDYLIMRQDDILGILK